MAKNDGRASFALEGDPAGWLRGVQLSLRGLDQLKGGFTGVARVASTLTGAMTGFGGALAAIGIGGLGLLVQQSFEFASQLVDVSTRIGVGTDALQELRHAASMSGASVEDLETGLRNLNRRLAEAASGDASATRLFEDLGISIRDAAGNTRNAGDVMGDFAEKIKATQSPAERIRLAMEAFGKAGTQLIPMLAEGREGLQAMREEAHRLGLVLDKEMLREAEAAGDAMDRMATTLKVNVTRAVITIGPLLITLAEQLGKVASAAKAAFDFFGSDATVSLDELNLRVVETQRELSALQAEMVEAQQAGPGIGPSAQITIQGLRGAIALAESKLLALQAIQRTREAVAVVPEASAGTDEASGAAATQMAALAAKVRSAALELALPDAVTRSIVDFSTQVEELAAKVPAKAEELRGLARAFAEIKTTATDAAAAAGAKGLGVENSMFAGFEQIRKLKADTDAFASGIKKAAQDGIPAARLFPLIAEGAQGLDTKMAALEQQFADQPVVLERLKQSLGGLQFGGLQRELDGVARALQDLPKGSVTLIDTAEGINTTFTPALRNAGWAASDLGEMLLDGIPAAAGKAGGAFVTLTGPLNIFGLTVDEVARKVRQLQADLQRFYSLQGTLQGGTGS